MIPRRRGLLLALAAMLAGATGAVAQGLPLAPRPGTAAPGQPAAGIRPAMPAQSPPGGVAQPQAATGTPQRLGRRFPAYSPLPPPRPEPRVSVSVVSPQGPSVFGRRTHGGSEPRGGTADQRMMSGMGGGQ